MKNQSFIRLPLQQTYNTRDLGGYATANGDVTRWKAFLRSDEPAYCTPTDIRFLLEYGLRTVIDLRSRIECKLAPNPFANVESVHYINIPLGFDDIHDDASLEELNNAVPGLANFYLYILQEKHYQIREIFELMIDRLPHTTLFHCVVGKDRTGVIAMLLLSLAGVSKGDVITNYEVTYSHVSQNPRFQDALKSAPTEIMQSKPEFILPAYDLILHQHGGAANYLTSIGLTSAQIAKLKAQLLAD
ncbi:MAG: tyrosine-protein phosphatase [Eubacteriales bacterium]|nr:tyrosine-protein phosphatase [Eubacteriales bacterium]